MRIPASVRVSWRGFGGTFFAKKVPPILVFPGLSDMNVQLRLMTVDDIPEAMRLKDLAGWNQTAADWERFLSRGPGRMFRG